ncbi:putative nuclease HARBI1 isoform X1 [Festucalex cinctus]
MDFSLVETRNICQEETQRAAAVKVVLRMAAAGVIIMKQKRKKEAEGRKNMKKRRTVWVRECLLQRTEVGQYEKLLQQLEDGDVESFKNYLKVEPDLFHELVERLTPRIQKKDTNIRRALEPGLKLAITLRYMASGENYKSLCAVFRVAHNTIANMVPEVCHAIYEELHEEYIKLPTTEEEWKQVAQGFSDRWNFHHTLGAIDGRHVAIQGLTHSGSPKHNYKGYSSIVMLAVVDSQYKFMYLDVGCIGSKSDAGIFKHSEFYTALEEGVAAVPPPEPLPGDDHPTPYFFVGDDSFPLKHWLITPYTTGNMTKPERVFNYRLSRARRIVENAFGILSHRFRCLLTTMLQKLTNVETIVLACCCLHNLLATRNPQNINTEADREELDADNYLWEDGTWRSGDNLDSLQVLRGNGGRKSAQAQRDDLRDYYVTSGKVSWQDKAVEVSK